MAALFQGRAAELQELRAKQLPVNLTERHRQVDPVPPPPEPERVISPDEAMRLAFDEATDARSRKFLSEGMKLGAVAIEGDRPARPPGAPRPSLGADHEFEREMFGTAPLRVRKPGR